MQKLHITENAERGHYLFLDREKGELRLARQEDGKGGLGNIYQALEPLTAGDRVAIEDVQFIRKFRVGEQVLEEKLEEIEQGAVQSIADGTDEGHTKLVSDLADLLKRAQEGKYHDFHPNGLDMPKVSLISAIDALKANVMSGAYDN